MLKEAVAARCAGLVEMPGTLSSLTIVPLAAMPTRDALSAGLIVGVSHGSVWKSDTVFRSPPPSAMLRMRSLTFHMRPERKGVHRVPVASKR